MKSNSSVRFGDLRQFLGRLGFQEKRISTAWTFEHPREGLVAFRLYRDDETVGEGDLRSTRRFLDMPESRRR